MDTHLKRFARIAILSAASTLLMYLEFPLPFFPGFLKYDFSEIPALVGAFAMGPGAGVCIVLVKALLHLPVTATFGVGELANIIVGAVFVSAAGAVYALKKTRAGALVGMLCGTAAMAVVGALANFYIMLPFYMQLMGFSLEALLAMAEEFFLPVTNMATLVIYVFGAFNIFKGLTASVITFFIYKRISKLLKT
jgi:riboflavin transporter FmnP